MRILETKEVKLRIDREKLNLQRAIENQAPENEIMLIEANKAIWERILYHVKKGKIVTLDENDRLELHINVPRA